MARNAWGYSSTHNLGDQIRPDGSRVGGRLSSIGFGGVSLAVDGQEGKDFALALQGRLEESIADQLDGLHDAYWRAMERVVQAGKGRLREDIVSGGFHKAVALSKTWRGTTYPKAKNSLDVAGWLTTKAGVIIEAFTEGATITVSGNAQFLAIPLGPAKAIIRRLRVAKMKGSRVGGPGRNAFGHYVKDDSYIEQVASALGVSLRPIISADRQSGVLVADDGRTLTPTGLDARNQARAATPLFALAKTAKLSKRIKGEDLLDEIRRNFPDDFIHALMGELTVEQRGEGR